MNKRFLSLGLAFCCASSFIAHAQEPPGCVVKTPAQEQASLQTDDSDRLPKRKVLDLRSKKHRAKKKSTPRRSVAKRSTRQTESADLQSPFIASPIYLPQPSVSTAAAITESRGFLYILVGQKLYKVDEKSLRTVMVSQLGRPDQTLLDGDLGKKHKKLVASTEGEPDRTKTKKRKGSKADD